jgi:hypothetical protein
VKTVGGKNEGGMPSGVKRASWKKLGDFMATLRVLPIFRLALAIGGLDSVARLGDDARHSGRDAGQMVHLGCALGIGDVWRRPSAIADDERSTRRTRSDVSVGRGRGILVDDSNERFERIGCLCRFITTIESKKLWGT